MFILAVIYFIKIYNNTIHLCFGYLINDNLNVDNAAIIS